MTPRRFESLHATRAQTVSRNPSRQVGGDQFRGGRRRWGTKVGDEVADGEIDLVADGGDDGDLAPEDGSNDALVAKRGKILRRPTATTENQDVQRLDLIGEANRGIQRGDKLLGCTLPLDARRKQVHLGDRPAPGEDGSDITQSGAARRSDDADPQRIRGKRLLVRGVEQPFFVEARLQFLDGRLEGTYAERLEDGGNELITASWLIDGQLPERENVHSLLDLDGSERRSPAAKANGTDLGVLVLEGEVQMAGGGSLDLGDFASQPDIGELRLQHSSCGAVQLGDRVDVFFTHCASFRRSVAVHAFASEGNRAKLESHAS